MMKKKLQRILIRNEYVSFVLKCPVHLPRQNIFCPGQNQICPRQNNFVHDKMFIVHDKNFVHSLKIIFALRKLVSSHGQNFCPGQNIFCPRQNYFVLDKSDFVLDKKYFVWADGQGINLILEYSRAKTITKTGAYNHLSNFRGLVLGNPWQTFQHAPAFRKKS